MTTTTAPDEEQIHAALREVLDPDLGINVVDMGFVYGIAVDQSHAVTLTMTLTSPACPLTKVMEDQIQSAVVGSGLARSVHVEWVFSPVWSPARVTDEGREQLRAIGFSM